MRNMEPNKKKKIEKSISEEDFTGNQNFEIRKIVEYPFDRFTVKVVLTPNNEFIGVKEIEINADFRNFKQKLNSQEYFDVEQYYLEE